MKDDKSSLQLMLRHSNPNFLKGHMRTSHIGSKPFECTNCDINFVHLDEFENHLLKESRKCNTDEQKARLDTYKNSVRMGTRKANDTNTEIEYRKCPVCYNVHAHPQGLKVHMTQKHKGAMPFSCTQCREKFKSLMELEHHVLENVKLKCKNDKQLAKLQEFKSTIKKGVKKLTKNKLKSVLYLKCPVCYFIYSHKNTLKNHMLQQHKGVSPFVCGCRKSFVLFEMFESHLKESAKCDNEKQSEKLRKYKNTVKNGFYDKNKRNN